MGRVYEPVKGRVMIYIPADVHKDSAFPFKPREAVVVEIEGDTLVIRRFK
jgi:hypothetical protein